MKNESEQFFSIFNIIADNITNEKTKKAIIFTLLFFITNSLFINAPRFKGQIHRVRHIFKLLCRVNKNHHPCVWEVLVISEEQHDEEIKFLIQMLSYFQRQMFFPMSINQLFGGLLHGNIGSHFQLFEDVSNPMTSSGITDFLDPVAHRKEVNVMYDSSNLNAATDRLSNNNTDEFLLSSLLSNQLPLPSKQSNDSSESNTKLSNLAAQFVNTLDAERKYDTKRIEEKLDNILKVLNSSSELKEKCFSLNTGKQTNDEETRSTLGYKHPFVDIEVPSKQTSEKEKKTVESLRFSEQIERSSQLNQLFEKDHSAVNSLFESFNKSQKSSKVCGPKPCSRDSTCESNNQSRGQWSGGKTTLSLPVSAAGGKQGGQDSVVPMNSRTQNKQFCDKPSTYSPFNTVWVPSSDHTNYNPQGDLSPHDGFGLVVPKLEVIESD